MHQFGLFVIAIVTNCGQINRSIRPVIVRLTTQSVPSKNFAAENRLIGQSSHNWITAMPISFNYHGNPKIDSTMPVTNVTLISTNSNDKLTDKFNF